MFKLFKKVDFSDAFSRFYIASGLSIICSFILMRFIHLSGNNGFNDASIVNAFLVGFILFLISINVRLLKEANAWSLNRELLVNLIFILIGIMAYLFWMPNDYDSSTATMFRFPFYIAGIIAILHLMVSYIPFLSKGTNRDFWEYNKRVFISYVESAFFAIFLYASLGLAIGAIQNLFEVDIDGEVYGYLAVLLGGIFHSLYFLSKFPAVDYDDHIDELNRPFLVFVQYILIPVTLIYMAILFAYGLKIGISWNLPKGWVAQLSLWFSVMGLFCYLMNYFSYEFRETYFVKLFNKYFFAILAVPTTLLFVSIYRRLSDYGVTEERYIIALIGVWLALLITTYGLKKLTHLKWIPISLGVFIAFSLISGPLNMFTATVNSQSSRLYKDLLGAEVIKSGELFDLSDHDRANDISNALNFLDNRSNLSFINDWLNTPIGLNDDHDLQEGELSNAQIIGNKIGLSDSDLLNAGSSNYFSYYNQNNGPVDITDYSSMKRFELYDYNKISNHETLKINEDGAIEYISNEVTHILDHRDLLRRLNSKYKNHNDVLQDDLILDTMIENTKIRLLFTTLNGRSSGNSIFKIEGANGILLIGPAE